MSFYDGLCNFATLCLFKFFVKSVTYPWTYPRSSNQPYCEEDDLEIKVSLSNFDFGRAQVNVCQQLFKEVLELNCEDTHPSQGGSMLVRF